MKIQTILFFIMIPGLGINAKAQAPTHSKNYIQSFDVQVPGVFDQTSLNIDTHIDTAIQIIQYYDGLGRLSQVIQKGITPDGDDLIKPFKYNNAGLDEFNYEPYSIKTKPGEFRDDFETNQPDFYKNTLGYDVYALSPVEYEKSPQYRLLKQGAPGADWQLDPGDHYNTFSYLSNNNSEAKLTAINWYVDGNICKKGANYVNNQLFVTKTINEEGAETYEFKNKEGNVVLKRSVLEDGTLVSTYYVYDDFELLRFVISPEGSAQIPGDIDATSPLAAKYVYCYKYDARKRLIEKQIPGKAPEYYVYDKTDKLILYQDGNMRKETMPGKFEWLFTKYDALGRTIITGIMYIDKNTSQSTLQSEANTTTRRCWEIIYFTGAIGTSIIFYSNDSYPIRVPTQYKILSVNYYDTYRIYNSATAPPSLICSTPELILPQSTGTTPVYEPYTAQVAGLPTVSFIAFDQLSMVLPSVNYYDKYGRVIRTGSNHHLEGYDLMMTQYKGLTGNIKNLQHLHYAKKKKIAPYNYTYSKIEEFDYTYEAGRTTGFEYTFNGNPVKQIVTNTYNPLGKLITKQIGEGTYLVQKIDYEYNIRGWLTKINDPANVSNTGDLFGEELLYNKKNENIGNVKSYNGNISAVLWQTAQPTGTTTPVTTGLRAYSYLYDKLNRLLYGKYFETVSGSLYQNDRYSEFIHTGSQTPGYRPYDLNGNILSLNRFGMKSPNNSLDLIDQLTYYYHGNRLIGVNDAVSTNNGGDFVDNGHIVAPIADVETTWEMSYDANGNLTKDNNKGIVSISYNNLNLPVSINKTGSMRVEYLYDATGTKRQQKHYTNIEGSVSKTTDFIGNFVYENGVPAYNIYNEGRIVYNTDGTYFGEAFIKDHLGNVRVTCRLDHGAVKVRQVDSYYPFGMNIKGLSQNSTDGTRPNEYLYNGKMFQDEMGLNWLDYGARFYDAVLGRWHSPDPLSEVSRRWSPYTYGKDNPIRFIDPDGMLDKVFITGDEADEATKQLQNSSSLTITRDSKSGELSATGEAKTESDKQLLAAINDPNVDVNVSATNSLTTTTGANYSGGAFMGNTIVENTMTLDAIPESPNPAIELKYQTVEARQDVNPNMLGSYDDAAGAKSGTFMKHEVTEAYEGAKISLATGVAAGPAVKGQANPIYDAAHIAASNQPMLTPADVSNARTVVKNIANTRNFLQNNPGIIQTLSKIRVR